jgi:hypothetical protein
MIAIPTINAETVTALRPGARVTCPAATRLIAPDPHRPLAVPVALSVPLETRRSKSRISSGDKHERLTSNKKAEAYPKSGSP